MSTIKETATYIASVNPPRRAKRPRTDLEPALTQASFAAQRPLRPHILPKDSLPRHLTSPPDESSASDADMDGDEDEYEPPSLSAPVNAPKRRGRKPGPLSRSARESQRKLNHSRIEKARRTKINETLATLSAMVAEADRQKALVVGPKDVSVEKVKDVEAGGGKGKEKGEKEFKLDVLVKVVVYMQELIEKVKELEGKVLKVDDISTGSKRKRPVEDEVEAEVEVVDVSPTPLDGDDTNRTLPSQAGSQHPTPSPRLPPISSWLPHLFVDPSFIPLAGASDVRLSPSTVQLPTPPLSGGFHVPYSLPAHPPPTLKLPGPAHPLPESTSAGSEDSMRQRPTSNASGYSRSPPLSPMYTPEDETAASLLLQMSSSSSSVSSVKVPNRSSSLRRNSSGKPQVDGHQWGRAAHSRPVETLERKFLQAETPSSILGMGRSS